jgi:cyclic pyranopterin phosphate synthase
MKEPQELTHVDAEGRAHMVDISGKPATRRQARAGARVHMRLDVLEKLQAGTLRKGDALMVARLAGIQAAKQTPHLVPLCHGLHLDHVEIEAQVDLQNGCVRLQSEVACTGATGVEMEAIVAVSIAAVTVYDMCKALDRSMVIDGIELLEKSGGQSGTYTRNEATRG